MNAIERITNHESRNAESTILQRVAGGDESASRACIDAYGGLVWSLARRWCGQGSAAEDAVQDIFIELWKSAGRFDASKSAEKTFVAMIARRKLIDRLRRKGVRPEPAPIEDAATVPGDTAERIEQSADAAAAARVLATLRPEQRRCIELSIHHGMSHGEIADSIGLPLGTVKSHIRRGITTLRDRLTRPLKPARLGVPA